MLKIDTTTRYATPGSPQGLRGVVASVVLGAFTWVLDDQRYGPSVVLLPTTRITSDPGEVTSWRNRHDCLGSLWSSDDATRLPRMMHWLQQVFLNLSANKTQLVKGVGWRKKKRTRWERDDRYMLYLRQPIGGVAFRIIETAVVSETETVVTHEVYWAPCDLTRNSSWSTLWIYQNKSLVEVKKEFGALLAAMIDDYQAQVDQD